MAPQPTELTFNIDRSLAADEQEVAELSQSLREDLVGLGVESVKQARGGEAPVGSKGDPLTLGTLVVTLGPTALAGLITILQSWLTRHERNSLTLQSKGRTITVKGPLSKDQQQVITEWLHA
jgi:hypothetical protein